MGGSGGEGGAGSTATGVGGSGGEGGAGSTGSGTGGEGGCTDTTGAGGGGGGGGGDQGPASGELLWLKPHPIIDFRSYEIGDIQVATDAQGNIVVASVLGEGIDFGGGPLSISDQQKVDGVGGLFVAKFDSAGQYLWAERVSAGNTGMAIDASGNIVLAGAGVTRLDSNGQLLWQVTPEVSTRDVAIAADGSIYAVGTANGGLDVALSKLDAGGQVLWKKTFGGGSVFSGMVEFHVALGHDGNVVIGGGFYDSLAFPGGPTLSTTPGESDLFVASLDADGNALWAESFPEPGSNAQLRGIGVDGAGGIVFLGLNGTGDFGGGPTPAPAGLGALGYVVRLSDMGSLLGVHGLYGEDPEYRQANALTVAANGDAYVSGRIGGNRNFGGGMATSTPRAFVVKLDGAGSLAYTTLFGDAPSVTAFGGSDVALDPAGAPVFAGILVGPANLTVAKLAP